MEQRLARALGHLAALCAAIVLVVAITTLYVSTEDAYYFWDYAVYQNLAIQTSLAFQQSTTNGLAFLRQSTIGDYNAFFAVPLVPLLRWIGETRLSYELALNLTYLLPFALVMGAIATTLVPAPRARVFWSTAAVTLLTPMAWIPSLRGYPDVGAALLVVLAVWACLVDPGFERPRTIVLVGVLLMLAVVYRRHFLFAASALLVTVAAHAALGVLTTPNRSWRQAALLLGRVALRLLLTLAAGLMAAFVFSRPVALRLVSHDFYGLYTAYLNSPGFVAGWYVKPYGWMTLAGAVLGFYVGWRHGTVDRTRASFLALFGIIGVTQWIVLVRQIGEQYTYHFTPIVILGLVALGFTLAARAAEPWRSFVPYLLQIFVITNAFFGIAPLDLTRLPVPLRGLLASTWSPLTRDDQHNFGLLVSALRELTKREDPIFVAASSTVLNPDILMNAERSLYGWPNARLKVLDTPAVDSRDQYPLDALLQANVVVVVSPLQVHLGADEQRVVKVVHDMFTLGVEIARDFTKVTAEPFVLQEGAEATIYKRVRPSAMATGLSALRYMQEQVGRVPGSQADWAMVSERFPSWIAKRADGAATVTWHPAHPGEIPAPVAVYLLPAPERVKASGLFHFLDSRCPGAALAFSSMAADGKITDRVTVERKPGETEAFEVSFTTVEGARLVLRLLPGPGQTSIDYCLLQIDALVVRKDS